MQKLIIKGKRELIGKISISGSKNSTLPILAASILANHVYLKNIDFDPRLDRNIDIISYEY